MKGEKKATDANPKQHIIIKGARQHNLQNVDLTLPRNRLIVITGVSGSGKSSLTIDTLFAEGQRRYVESLSAYARQFLMRMSKPQVDYIKGISPAIAIEQKVITRSSRSTVGTLTEIYDYLRLLFARIGATISPISGKTVRKDSTEDVCQFVMSFPAGTRLQVLAPFRPSEGLQVKRQLDLVLQKGLSRIIAGGQTHHIEEVDATQWQQAFPENAGLLIDRMAVAGDDDARSRLADSIQTAFYEGQGECTIDIGGEMHHFSNRFEADGMSFDEPSPHLFNFNSPYGACPRCEGFGQVIDIDEDLVIPIKSLSVYENAIACWRGEKMKAWKDKLVRQASKFDFPIHRPVENLTKEQHELLWAGNQHFEGLNAFFEHIASQAHKIQYRVMLAKYKGRTTCRACGGSRLRKDAGYVKIGGKAITDIVELPIKETAAFFGQLQLDEHQHTIAKRILLEINNRLNVMMDVGLGYLTLNRQSSTLSGGETQRINLTRSLGSTLTNSMYILDEPSIGLHPRDTQRLIKVLKDLRNLGNTVIVVEHEEEVMRSADHLVDIGPLAGQHGGRVVFSGSPSTIGKTKQSLTADYLSGKKQIDVPKHRRQPANAITVKNARQHNLKNIDVRFPLNAITVVTGVSGSGKTTLVKKILHPAMQRLLEGTGNAPGMHDAIEGDMKMLATVELIDQNPLGRSSRSNPVTYIKAYDAIRDLYSRLQISKIHGFKPKHFSFNVEGGRCETCKGDGFVTVEMQFLADVRLLCEDCNGKRFKPMVLEAEYRGKSIYDLLEMSVDEAIEFFADNTGIAERLQPLADVGLGYVKLGQSSSTLSGGEAQRVKLASYLGKGQTSRPVLFIFDEPSTGLHFNDIKKLLQAFNALVEIGHTVVIVEHNPDIIKCADWVVDLGPEGGDEGGQLLYQGPPEGLLEVDTSHTAAFLKEKLK